MLINVVCISSYFQLFNMSQGGPNLPDLNQDELNKIYEEAAAGMGTDVDATLDGANK